MQPVAAITVATGLSLVYEFIPCKCFVGGKPARFVQQLACLPRGPRFVLHSPGGVSSLSYFACQH